MLTLASSVGFGLELNTKVLYFALYEWNNWVWQMEIGGRSEQRVLIVSKREARRKRMKVARLREREEVASNRRARLANRILKES